MPRVRPPVPLLLAAAAAALLPAAGGSAELRFSDRTEAAGLHHVYAVDPQVRRTVREYTAGGAAADFDRDGWQDLFVLAGGDRADRLFLNQGDGTFSDASAGWGLSEPHIGVGIAAGDTDGDGWIDVLVTSAGLPDGSPQGSGPNGLRLYRNRAGTGFSETAALAGLRFETLCFGSAFGDHDLDGDLDLVLAGLGESRLFRNRGDGTFTDATVESGFARSAGALGLSCRLADMDGDRYPEILFVADFGGSLYFENNGNGTFSELTSDSATALEENGMGQTAGDLDGDGLLDWYVTSIYDPARGWSGNKLYLNQGEHYYREEAAARGVEDGGFGWGTVAADLDHDGWLDLAETNGSSEEGFRDEPSYLWLNTGGGRFQERALEVGFRHLESGRGLLAFDYDGDGDQDLLVFTNSGPLRLFRNDLQGARRNWLQVFLDTSGRPGLAPDGVGSRVTVTAGGRSQVRWLDGGGSYLSQGELSAHFGLGAQTVAAEVRVEWADGSVLSLRSVPANRTLVLRPEGLPGPFARGDCNGDGLVAGQVADAVYILNYNFRGGEAPWCAAACDANGDGLVAGQVADAVYLLNHNFRGGPPPRPPYPACGPGELPGDASLGCLRAPACR